LRNLIAHEYATDQMKDIYTAVATMTPVLLDTVPKLTTYVGKMTR